MFGLGFLEIPILAGVGLAATIGVIVAMVVLSNKNK